MGVQGRQERGGLLQNAKGGSFYSRCSGTFGPGAEGAGSSTASVEEEERRESAEERWFQRGWCPPNRWGWGTKAKNWFWFSLFSCSFGCKPASVPYLNTHYCVYKSTLISTLFTASVVVRIVCRHFTEARAWRSVAKNKTSLYTRRSSGKTSAFTYL